MVNQASLTIISGAISRVASITLTTISIPMAISYFGTHSYGSLMIVTSIVSTMQLLGFSAGSVVSIIGPQLSTPHALSKLLRTIFVIYAPYLLILLTAVIALHSDILSELIHRFYEGKVDGSQFNKVFLYSSIALLVSLVAAMFQNTFYSMHKVYYMNIYQLLTTISAFLSLVLTIKMRGDIVLYSLYTLYGSITVCTVMVLHYLAAKEPETSPVTINDNERLSYRNILTTSISVTLISAVSIIINQADNLIIPYFLSNDELVIFTIAFKIITYQLMAYHIMYSAVMPSVGRWFANSDWENIRKIHNTILDSCIYVGIIIGLANIFFLQTVINKWLGKAIQINNFLIFMFSLYLCVFGIYSSNYIVYSCFNVKRKIQMFASVIEPALKVFGSYYLIKYWGVFGAASSVLLLAVFVTLPITALMLRHLSNHKIPINASGLSARLAIAFSVLWIAYGVSTFKHDSLKYAFAAFSICTASFLFWRHLQSEIDLRLTFWRKK